MVRVKLLALLKEDTKLKKDAELFVDEIESELLTPFEVLSDSGSEALLDCVSSLRSAKVK